MVCALYQKGIKKPDERIDSVLSALFAHQEVPQWMSRSPRRQQMFSKFVRNVSFFVVLAFVSVLLFPSNVGAQSPSSLTLNYRLYMPSATAGVLVIQKFTTLRSCGSTLLMNGSTGLEIPQMTQEGFGLSYTAFEFADQMLVLHTTESRQMSLSVGGEKNFLFFIEDTQGGLRIFEVLNGNYEELFFAQGGNVALQNWNVAATAQGSMTLTQGDYRVNVQTVGRETCVSLIFPENGNYGGAFQRAMENNAFPRDAEFSEFVAPGSPYALPSK